MPKFYETESFKELEAKWNQKLEDEEFPDIEKTVGDERILKQNAGNSYRQQNQLQREAKLSYYEQLSEAVHHEEFDHPIEKLVITMVSKGCKIKEISAKLKELDDPRCRGYRQTVRFIIRKYENRWGIKKWRQNQLKIKKWAKVVIL